MDETEQTDSPGEEIAEGDGSARDWLAEIERAKKAFEPYHDVADSVDKAYASLANLSNHAADRDFKLFWANIQVLTPSIYARPPVPVVVPRFQDRSPVKVKASEVLERCAIVASERTGLDDVMRLIRDDLAVVARGLPWVRLDDDSRAVAEHLSRKDFLHEPARKWSEVGWAAKRAWLTEEKMRKRFGAKAAQEAAYNVRKDDADRGAASKVKKAEVWEIWSRTANKVYWVTKGHDQFLDHSDPYFELENFYPCPKPAYATTERDSLIPIPDMLFYRDQLAEVSQLTARIHALADAVKVRGFYPAGAGEIGDAIQQALMLEDDRNVLVPISNWAAFGGASAKDVIIWLPIEQIAQTITQLIALRRQVIEDVYEIVGLSDIMRGTTQASETATAQQIKAQYGSVRIRDKVSEMVRVARDTIAIMVEVLAENVPIEILLEMAQIELPSEKDIKRQIDAITRRAEAQAATYLNQNPQADRGVINAQLIAQIKPQIAELEATVTVEKVDGLLKDQRLRPFALDIETDSTIQVDENAEKQRRAEFLQALGGVMAQLSGLLAAEPSAAGFASEVLKFALAPFRAGRDLDNAIDEFAKQMQDRAAQMSGQQQPSPDQIKAQAEVEKIKAEIERIKADIALKQADAQTNAAQSSAQASTDAQNAQIDALARQREQERQQAAAALAAQQAEAEAQRKAELHAQQLQMGQLQIEKLQAEIGKAIASGNNPAV